MISWPWDSLIEGFDEETGFPIYDRTYLAEQLRTVLKKVFSNGVFAETPEAFVVTTREGNNVNVSAGTCHVQGGIGVEQENRVLMFSPDSKLPRIDTIVLRWDNNIESREIDLYVKQGVAAANPVRPSLTRTESIWELGIADVLIPAGSSSITQSRITDTRLETQRCGIVTPFTTIDTTTFFNQIQQAINDNIYDIERIIRELEAETERTRELADALINETFVGQVLDILETLAKKHVMYLSIQDDATDSIDDSNGDKILGDVRFQIGGSGSGECDCEAASNAEIDTLFHEIRKVNNG